MSSTTALIFPVYFFSTTKSCHVCHFEVALFTFKGKQ